MVKIEANGIPKKVPHQNDEELSLVGVIGSKWNTIRAELIAMHEIVVRSRKDAILLLAR